MPSERKKQKPDKHASGPPAASSFRGAKRPEATRPGPQLPHHPTAEAGGIVRTGRNSKTAGIGLLAAVPASLSTWPALVSQAMLRRKSLRKTAAFRLFSGSSDGVEGVFIDIYGPGAVLNLYEGRVPPWFVAESLATETLSLLAPLGVTAIYAKPFPRDRSRLGGTLPEIVTSPQPLAGAPLPESFTIRENNYTMEVRLYDGMSTGLFLDQRDNRRFVAEWCAQRSENAKSKSNRPRVLNTFAYTCGFSLAAATGGALTTSVDVSGRYLEWGQRNFEHNALNAADHRFAKFDTFEYFAYAQRKKLTFDLIILDPPSFSTGSKRKNIATWSSLQHYPTLIRDAASLLAPRGVILASTNTQELCRQDRLEREIIKGLGSAPQWVQLPPVPIDFAQDHERFAARAFQLA